MNIWSVPTAESGPLAPPGAEGALIKCDGLMTVVRANPDHLRSQPHHRSNRILKDDWNKMADASADNGYCLAHSTVAV